VQDLKNRNNELDSKLGAADAEVRRLRERVHYLEGVLNEHSVPYVKTRHVAAGATLFLALFSMALFFQSPLLRPDPTASSIVQQQQPRHLMNSAPVQPVVVESASTKASKTAAVSSRIRIVDDDSAAALVPVGETPAAPSPFIRRHDKELYPNWDRPNTDYLYCPSAAHVRSPDKGAHADEPTRISLLLPTDAFNGTMDFRASGAPMVEIMCSVVDVFPAFVGTTTGNGGAHEQAGAIAA